MATIDERLRLPSLESTRRFGVALGMVCRAGDIIAFGGDLGAGKTTLIQAVAKGAGVHADEYVCSPSFALLHEYQGHIPLYHLDLYRLRSADEVLALGLDDYFQRDGIALVEWYDRAPELFPVETLIVRLFPHGASGRQLHLFTEGTDWQQRIGRLLAERTWLEKGSEQKHERSC
ncbi:tRNA (adenosine(37)-N6)-threonylcarbamoyltransferase complex ATPase subunit type 1 TsaE [Desulfofustis limnaeus]|jgi:tRNA threonylcarbamoyladenosine biosynthesis protein TsaE|uniref:tRNA threonylcarbamoyladenosine biosynthesis protein TsaE n=1 Tax=Desulfofustis limnaeus TaxID=2740163 RepID=A0ABN6M2N9_9BACT|nr:tRNA (adenosine(37)-N6)-threonylcarbamoyltransferase complex ATPase subunit type 1 TsaE [Desulfofustis limnaeus]MDX9894794.1 tRNA (adenosine(37)-N6)-threonylcarbamoyltransferase complex ATPase subunit type 1 TsaE [Desulfofustis sp.]BDD87146.1 tRNA (adenosine(37)-N6)-threonylcarbamoyltransferase complex ATPase subunit type 1 TsaE [Desulfofustis limnaeus]